MTLAWEMVDAESTVQHRVGRRKTDRTEINFISSTRSSRCMWDTQLEMATGQKFGKGF